MVDAQRTLEVLTLEYPGPFKMLRRAEYVAPRTLKGEFQVVPNWCYAAANPTAEQKPSVNHFTAAEAVFSLNQSHYTLLACMGQEGQFQGVRKLSLDEMNGKKLNDMYITAYEFDFRTPFESTSRFSGELVVKKMRTVRSGEGATVFTWHDWSFEGGKSYGTSRAAVRIARDELLPKESR